MKILLSSHRPLESDDPRGAEKSFSIIIKYLRQFHDVDVVSWQYYDMDNVKKYDLVLTYATAAPKTATYCIKHNVPYILLIRWFRLIQPLPPGNLMRRDIDHNFVERHRYIFDNAKSIITNNKNAVKIIKRYYGVNAKYSYVPIEGEIKGQGNKQGKLLLITPNKAVGEIAFIDVLSEVMPKEKLLIVNKGDAIFVGDNIETIGYVENMDKIWQQAKILLYPLYHNDVCGTSRVAIEAMQYGIPVIANRRSGICEKGIIPVSYNAPIFEWTNMIESINKNYKKYVKQMHYNFENYNTKKQLEIIRKEIEK